MGKHKVFHKIEKFSFSIISFALVAITGLALSLGPDSLQAQTAYTIWLPLITTEYQSAYTIWPNSATPAILSGSDTSAVELGVKFRSDKAGYVTGVRFYKATANTGTHIGNLWSSNGTLLGSVTFTGETASGWQQVSYSSPILIQANTTYIVSYYTNVGRYSYNSSYFTLSGVDNGPLHALAAGVDGPNGVYQYGSSSAFPSQSYNSNNYWVDITFRPSP